MTNNSNNLLGNKIKSLRQEKHLTRDEFAKELGVSKSVVVKWEIGERIPRQASQELLCDYFNIDMNYLHGLTPIRNSYREDTIIQFPLYDCSKLDEKFSADCIIDTFVFPDIILDRRKEYFSIKLRDNSMLGSGFSEGDIAIFEKKSQFAHD